MEQLPTTPGMDDSRDGGGRTASGTAVEDDCRDAAATTPGMGEVDRVGKRRSRVTPGAVTELPRKQSVKQAESLRCDDARRCATHPSPL